MKTTIKVEKEIEINILIVKAGVRYWEDAEVNGTPDIDGNLIPCRDGDLWCPVIDINKGNVVNWEEGKRVEIHFKVCDTGSYYLMDKENGTIFLKIENDYVPSILCPNENGYGDYIIMDIDENGNIQNWKPDISDFNQNTEEDEE